MMAHTIIPRSNCINSTGQYKPEITIMNAMESEATFVEPIDFCMYTKSVYNAKFAYNRCNKAIHECMSGGNTYYCLYLICDKSLYENFHISDDVVKKGIYPTYSCAIKDFKETIVAESKYKNKELFLKCVLGGLVDYSDIKVWEWKTKITGIFKELKTGVHRFDFLKHFVDRYLDGCEEYIPIGIFETHKAASEHQKVDIPRNVFKKKTSTCIIRAKLNGESVNQKAIEKRWVRPNQWTETKEKKSPNKTIRSGKWTKKEHMLFVEGMEKHGKKWTLLSDMVGLFPFITLLSHGIRSQPSFVLILIEFV